MGAVRIFVILCGSYRTGMPSRTGNVIRSDERSWCCLKRTRIGRGCTQHRSKEGIHNRHDTGHGEHDTHVSCFRVCRFTLLGGPSRGLKWQGKNGRSGKVKKVIRLGTCSAIWASRPAVVR